MTFFKNFWCNDLFLFYIAFNVIVNVISPINSSPSNQRIGQENNRNHLLQLDTNYCKNTGTLKDELPLEEKRNDLITAIIRQMQDNGDGTLSCISIFADDDDSFAQGAINCYHVFLYIF